MSKARFRDALPFVALAGLILLAYAAALGNDYVWDDRWFLVDFAWLDSPAAAWRTAFSPLFMGDSYVRPLPLLTLYADNLFGEHRAAVSHGVNIIIHFASACLVYLLARDAIRRCFPSPGIEQWAAFASASLFAVHPALTEAVVWVSSRFDLMVTLFTLAGLWLSTRDRWSDVGLALAMGGIFALAAFSKELAVVFPVLLALFVVLRSSAGVGALPTPRVLLARRWFLVFAAIVLAGCAYLVVRLYVLSGSAGVRNPAFDVEQWVRSSATIARYLQLTFLPFAGNSPQHTFIWSTDSKVADYLPQIAGSMLFVAATAWLVVRRNPLGLVLAAWSVGYVLVIHLVPINVGNNTVQQRFMYLPTAVLFSLIPYGLTGLRLSSPAKKAASALLVVFLLASVLVVRSIVPAWKADFSLWSWARQIDPASAMARENLIWAYLDAGMYEELDREVELLVKDGVVTSINGPLNVGVSHHRRGDMERALFYYNMAREHLGQASAAQRSAVYSNIAAVYVQLGRRDEAMASIELAVKADRNNHLALANLLVFCEGYPIRLPEYDPVVLRRAREMEPINRRALLEHRPDIDLSGLCPASFRGGR